MRPIAVRLLKDYEESFSGFEAYVSGRAGNVRVAALLQLLREAARSDADLAELFQDSLERRRLDSARGVALATGREPTKVESDGNWAVTSPEVYLLLVADSGWTPEEYEQWVTHILERITPLS